MEAKRINLEMAGSGFVFYSPFAVAGIAEGEDYLETGFENPDEVERQAIDGRLVGVSTGSPGKFIMEILAGYPTQEILENYKYKLRLGVKVRDQLLCVRDLFDFIDWTHECPESQKVILEDGFYHITLLSEDPPSGVMGDNQIVLVYLNKLNEMPKLKFNGVPTLC